MHRARKIAELTKERLRRAAVIIQSQNPSHTGVEPLAAGIADWHDALAPAGETTVIHCSHASRELVKIITLYQPSRSIWVDFKYRRKGNE